MSVINIIILMKFLITVTLFLILQSCLARRLSHQLDHKLFEGLFGKAKTETTTVT